MAQCVEDVLFYFVNGQQFGHESEVKFPPGVMRHPHFHREDRYATVLKGTWYTVEDREFARDKTIPLKPGSYMELGLFDHSMGK